MKTPSMQLEVRKRSETDAESAPVLSVMISTFSTEPNRSKCFCNSTAFMRFETPPTNNSSLCELGVHDSSAV